MSKKHKKKIDLGEVIGGILFLCLFLGLMYLGIFYESNVEITSSFFEDVSEAMKWRSE